MTNMPMTLAEFCARCAKPDNPLDKGISEAARQLGVSYHSVLRWINGKRKPCGISRAYLMSRNITV